MGPSKEPGAPHYQAEYCSSSRYARLPPSGPFGSSTQRLSDNSRSSDDRWIFINPLACPSTRSSHDLPRYWYKESPETRAWRGLQNGVWRHTIVGLVGLRHHLQMTRPSRQRSSSLTWSSAASACPKSSWTAQRHQHHFHRHIGNLKIPPTLFTNRLPWLHPREKDADARIDITRGRLRWRGQLLLLHP